MSFRLLPLLSPATDIGGGAITYAGAKLVEVVIAKRVRPAPAPYNTNPYPPSLCRFWQTSSGTTVALGGTIAYTGGTTTDSACRLS
ncbi:hypothetical protein GW17_00041143 [Ensete ventricosum]|nr:hypothetical protein GW17_00041143 [Ensete ventricosum]